MQWQILIHTCGVPIGSRLHKSWVPIRSQFQKLGVPISFRHSAKIIFQDKLKFYLPESLLYKINNPDAEFLIHIGIVLLVIVLIVLLIGDQI